MSKRTIVVLLLLIAVSGVAGGCAGTPSAAASPEASLSSAPSPSSSAALIASSAPTATGTPTATATPTATPTAEPTATPSPSPTPTPVPWAIHKSKVFKYQIKYPPDWIVTPGSASRADLIDDFDSRYVYIDRDTVSTSVDVTGTVDQEKAYYKSHYKAKLVSDKKVHVGSLSGRLLTFNGVDDGRKVRIQHLIIARGKVGYFVTMYSDPGNEAADAKLFLRMYNSFKPTS